MVSTVFIKVVKNLSPVHEPTVEEFDQTFILVKDKQKVTDLDS